MIPVALLGTGRVLPGRSVSTEEVAAHTLPALDAQRLKERTGIHTRNWVSRGTRAAPLGAEALRKALAAAQLEPGELARIIFVSSTGGDWLSPSTAGRIAAELELTGQCDCFDVANGCLGFLSAFDVAARSLATGMGPVAIVTVEIFSDMIVPEEARTFAIFGDAASAVILGPGAHDEGVLGVRLKTDPRQGLTATVEHPRWTRKMEPVRFGISNQAMSEGAVTFLADAARAALAMADLTVSEVDWLLPHQPNGPMFDRIVAAIDMPAHKTIKVVDQIGSSGAASIPFSLDVLMRSGRVKPTDTLLMVSVGAGVAYGAIVLKLGAGSSGMAKLRQ